MTRVASLRRGFPTFTAPFRWIGRSWRRIGVALVVALVIVLGPPLWWSTQLIFLPDIGAPFDEAAFRATTIPDENNAYRLYERAWGKYQPVHDFYKAVRNTPLDTTARWPVAAPQARQWADANREALALYRQAAELPDAMDQLPEFEGQHRNRWGRAWKLGMFQELAQLEASRLEASGDSTGAWTWYRANLRTIHLVSRHWTAEGRGLAQDWHRTLNTRIRDWAADPRTTPDLIRRAIDDVIACEALPPSESYTLKAEYLDVEHEFDNLNGPRHQAPGFARAIVSFLPVDLGIDQKLASYQTKRFLLREPERSRRTLKLAVANWLAYYDLPESARPRPDPTDDGGVDFFYPPSPHAPANAKLMSPQDLARWLDTCIDANLLLGEWSIKTVRRSERTNHRDLLIALAEELYRRDHGAEPPSLEVLVGPYLKRLPPEFEELRDETVPVFGTTRE
jgi:hypothetical protein